MLHGPVRAERFSIRAAGATLLQRSFRLDRAARSLVRRSGHILRVKSSKRCHDSGPNAHDAFLYTWPKQRDPKIVANEQFGAAHCRRTVGMGIAINFHLFHCRRRIVDVVAPTRRIALLVHLRFTTRVSGKLDVIF